MAVPSPEEVLAAEVARAAGKPGALRTLFVDLDGTLAPIVPDPAAATVPAAARKSLERLARDGWTVVVVSGRPRSQVRLRIPDRRIRVVGGHGAEGLAGIRRNRSQILRLRRIGLEGERLARGTPGARVERKPTGVAFHDREVPASRLTAWRRSVENLLEGHDLGELAVVSGRRVIEVRPAGIHKGLAVSAVLGDGRPGAHDASLVALGDDTTDEDMFRVIGHRGLSVRVGRPKSGTLARRRLPSPAAVGRFLELLADLSPGRTSGQIGSRGGGSSVNERR